MVGQLPRLLVIADASDRGARGVAELVAARHGARAVRTVTPATLTTLATWQHRIVRGRASTALSLPDGSWLADPPAAVVLNRTRWVITPTMSSEVDRRHAVMELHALLLSWLAGLEAVVLNPPTPANLAGVGLSELDLLARLAREGLPVRTFELTTRRRATPVLAADEAEPPFRRSPAAARHARVLVAGRTVLGATATAEPLCRRIAEVLGCPLLEVDVAREEPRGWVVEGVDPLPPLRVPAEVEAVADLVDRCAAGPSKETSTVAASRSSPAVVSSSPVVPRSSPVVVSSSPVVPRSSPAVAPSAPTEPSPPPTVEARPPIAPGPPPPPRSAVQPSAPSVAPAATAVPSAAGRQASSGGRSTAPPPPPPPTRRSTVSAAVSPPTPEASEAQEARPAIWLARRAPKRRRAS